MATVGVKELSIHSRSLISV